MKRPLQLLGYSAMTAVVAIASASALATPVRADTINAELLANGTVIQTWDGVSGAGTLAIGAPPAQNGSGTFDGVGYSITLTGTGNPPAPNPQILSSNTFDFTTSGSVPTNTFLQLLITEIGTAVQTAGFTSADQILDVSGLSGTAETTFYSASNTPFSGTPFSPVVTGGSGTTGKSNLVVAGGTSSLYSITEEYSGTATGGAVSFQGDMDVTATPLPATLPLLAGGLGLLGLVGRRKKRNNGRSALASV